MRLTLFVKGNSGVDAPRIELAHTTVSLHAHHFDHSDGCRDSGGDVAIHDFTPAHARQLIEMLTPIAAIPTHKLKVHSDGTGEDHHWWFECIGYPTAAGPWRGSQGEALEDYKDHVAATEVKS